VARRFAIERLGRLASEIKRLRYRRRLPLEEWEIAPAEGSEGRWKSIRVGEMWGGRGQRYRFRREISIPKEWEGETVCLRLWLGDPRAPTAPEGLLYLDGQPFQGVDRHHDEVLFTEAARSGEVHQVLLDLWSGMDSGPHRFALAELAVLDAEADAFYFDARVALQVAEVLDPNDLRRGQILNGLESALLQVDFREPFSEAFYRSLATARRMLQEQVYLPGEPNRARVHCVGHAHLDVAWMWTLAQTRLKAGRTFATALELMDRYPDFHFIQSQPQLYLFVKEDYPELYERVKVRVKEGRWEVTGGMWVEADCNIPCGESLVRQLLYGRRFFQREFGADGHILWLPDTFGFNGALPQLIARAGLRYFMTTKLSWNEYNPFPYDSFRWRGIDGTEVLTHFITTPCEQRYQTYNGDLGPAAVHGCWREYRQKREHGEVLLAFGHGDGGGGPTRDMVEAACRLRDLAGVPLVTLGRAEDFFQRLEADAEKLPVWVGELYLEYHRGTYTSQARVKRHNRKSEILYHQAELFASLAHLLGEPYPRERLNEGWHLILRNQFHDVLAGSSVGEVYEEAERDYQRVRELGGGALQEALARIAARIALKERSLVVFNGLSWERNDIVCAPLPNDLSDDFVLVDGVTGKEVPWQRVSNDEGKPALIFRTTGIPSCGYKAYYLRPGVQRTIPSSVSATKERLENEFFLVRLDSEGHIISIYDKLHRREVIPKGGRANLFQAFEDRPLGGDAWDINIFYQDKMWELRDLERLRVIEKGPVRAGVELQRTWHRSKIRQRIYLYAGVPRIDFETEVDWREHHILLKVAFPLEIHSTRATYEIQFGNVERPTHWNTSWDLARFEVPVQRWADLSEGNYGVSLLNDCKYGYDIKDNVMRLSLIKSASYPDPEADQGLHRFTYSLYPHAGDWRNGTIRRAAELNDSLLALWEPSHPGDLPVQFSLVAVDRENVLVDTVKLAEDGGDLIVRVYEGNNQRGSVTLRFGSKIEAAWECNLLEEPEEQLTPNGDSLTFFIKPYQVRTFRVRLSRLPCSRPNHRCPPPELVAQKVRV